MSARVIEPPFEMTPEVLDRLAVEIRQAPFCQCGCGDYVRPGRRYIRGHASYRRWPTFEIALYASIRPDGACWPWQGGIQPMIGYGRWGNRYAHRLSYELAKGVIPDGLEIDHLCRNRACVNPDHLEPVTGAENVRRGLAAQRSEVCSQGHDDWRFPPSGSRYCGECNRQRARAWTARRKAAKA